MTTRTPATVRPTPARPTTTGQAARLLTPPAPHAPLAWLVAGVIALIGLALRLYRLGFPHSLVFDETYYVKDAYSLSVSGYERQWPEDPNPAFEAGDPSGLLDQAEYVVHPPLGKWILALGQMLFGQDSSFGWRFSAAVVGALSIFLVVLIGSYLFSSVFLGGVAGVLLTVDGEHFVHSRTGLLDLFLMFFVVLAFGFLLLDRNHGRRRLLERVGSSPPWRSARGFGPSLGFRYWRLAAGISLGLAMGVKWTGLYALAVFGLMTVVWDVSARRAVGVQRPWIAALVKDSVPAFLLMVPTAVVTYVACWSGWIFTDGGWDRHWASENPGWWSWLPDWVVGLAHYHYTAYEFHTHLDSEHTYMSNPWGWIVQWRPTSFFYESVPTGEQGCTADACSSAITSLGNPVIWGLAPLAVLVLIFAWILRRDWRAGALIATLLATWGPWFLYQDRTIFTFYTIVMVPFVCLAVAYALGLVWGRTGKAARHESGDFVGLFAPTPAIPASSSRPTSSEPSAEVAYGSPGPDLGAPPGALTPSRQLLWRRVSVAVILGLAVLVFAYYWPIYTGTVIPYEQWQHHMWTPSWV